MERANNKRAVIVVLTVVLLVSLLAACTGPTAPPSPAPSPGPSSVQKMSPTPTQVAKPIPSPSPLSPKPAFKMPEPVISASLDVGSGGYIIAAALGDVMRKERGTTLRVIPVGTDVGRMALLGAHRAHLTWMGFGAYLAYEGLFEFADIEWGPQPLRLIATGLPGAGTLLIASGAANIKTYADAKGKRVSWVIGHPANRLLAEGALAFGGLTWADVVKVEMPSVGAAGTALVAGKIDMHAGMTSSAFCYELAAKPGGVYFPPFPHADKEGWKRVQSLLPQMKPILATVGSGLSKEKTLETGTYPNPSASAYDWMEPELAYQLAKMLDELWPVYSKATAPGMEQFDPERRIYDYVVPYHEGAVRYYKEIGKWTDAAQKNNDRLLARERVLKEAWSKAIARAAEEKVKGSDFPEFWNRVRMEALKAAGM